ncbi:hypothetical protein PYW08_011905 [Mythimna loreyi]|uniref:Uncharacterized protein n=1 Tax=Mythimna loreyi TaxID=667449 RepID=A0ACC2QKQ8_9NEOP|nr:hypothetical protein PYW08_011905 [Mythimna loreyi]
MDFGSNNITYRNKPRRTSSLTDLSDVINNSEKTILDTTMMSIPDSFHDTSEENQSAGYSRFVRTMSTYEIKPVATGDTEAILVLLRKTFFIDEPMNKAVGLCSDGTCNELEDYCKQYLPGDGWSFKAVDKEGNIVGVMVSGICDLKEPEEGSDYVSLAKKCPNPKFAKILHVLGQRETGAKLWEKFPGEHEVLDVKIAATDPGWRKKGIMNALLFETENLAKKRSVRILRMDTSSAYSAMAAERLGFTCMYSAPYSEIKLDGRPIIVPEAPHVDDSVYTKILFERNG